MTTSSSGRRAAGGQDLITSLRHDALGRPIEKVMPRGNASRTIDAQGELQGPPAPGFATAWTYYATPTGGPAEAATRPAACGGGAPVNQGGLLKSTGTSGLATITQVYDPAGRAVADARGRGTTCRTYSAEGRLTGDQAPGEASATSYAYDPAGALRTASGPTGTVSRAYDEAGRITRTLDSQGSEATVAYDAEGHRTRQTAGRGTIAAGPTYITQMAYDEEGRLTQLTDPAGRTYRASSGCLSFVGLSGVTIGPGGGRELHRVYKSRHALSAQGHMMRGIQAAIARGLLKSIPGGVLLSCGLGASQGFS